MDIKTVPGQDHAELLEAYRRACRLASREQFEDGRRLYLKIEATEGGKRGRR
jgi:hypothetical protein